MRYTYITPTFCAMNSHPHAAPELVLTTEVSPPTTTPVACPLLAAAKARAKALKKWRKQERLRFFSSVCSSLHALGFSF
jgi:hypothetical protein